jgi:peptide/nickel transport system substrate-binding protein
LFERAGYCRGRRLSLPLTFRSNVPSDRLFALTWQAQLRRDLGDCLSLEISGVESTAAYRQLDKGVFPLILLDWAGDYPAPDVYLTPLLACSRAAGDRCLEGSSVSFGSFWTAPGLQQQLQASESLSGAARTRLLQTIQRRTANSSAYIPVWQVAPRAWARPGLSTPRFDGSGRVLLQELSAQP